MPSDLGRVAGLTRYPVTSLAGEELSSAHLGPRGPDGDRSWAVHTEDGGMVPCRMVDLVGSGSADDGLLKMLGRERDTTFGIRAVVTRRVKLALLCT